MSLRRINALVKSLNNNMVSYNELMNLSDYQCVKVSRTYFHYLIAKATLLGIKIEDYYYVVNKYLEIEKMQNFLNGYDSVIPYYLMKVSDIKYLMLLFNDVPRSKVTFLKSGVSSSKLDISYDKIRREYQLKKELIEGKKSNNDNQLEKKLTLIRK